MNSRGLFHSGGRCHEGAGGAAGGACVLEYRDIMHHPLLWPLDLLASATDRRSTGIAGTCTPRVHTFHQLAWRLLPLLPPPPPPPPGEEGGAHVYKTTPVLL